MADHIVHMTDDAGVIDEAVIEVPEPLALRVARQVDEEPDTTIPVLHLPWDVTAPIRVARHIDEEPA